MSPFHQSKTLSKSNSIPRTTLVIPHGPLATTNQGRSIPCLLLVSKDQGVFAVPKVKQFLHSHQTAEQKHNYRYTSLKKELSKDMVISACDIICLKP